MAEAKKVETVWYENLAEGSFHEVEKNTDTERRLRREQRTYVDDDGEEQSEPAYKRLSGPPSAAAAKKAPGYIEPPAPEPVVSGDSGDSGEKK